LPVNLNQKTFILNKSVNKSRGDEHIIDVVSGATTTSHGAVEMVNAGLQRYREYLKEE
jgi:Na+-transporting NADH:ubiquinone oxidoreductase subunit C